MSVIYKDGTYYGSGIDGHLIKSVSETLPPRESLNFIGMDLSDDSQEKQTVIRNHRLSSAEKTAIFDGTKPGNTLVDVVANPSGDSTEKLRTIKIGDTIYELGGGISEEETIIDETGGVTTYRKSYVCTTLLPVYDLSSYDSLRFSAFNGTCYSSYKTLNQRFGIDTDTNFIYQSGMSANGTLLWTNSAQSSSFGAQTLSIAACANYNAVLVNIKFHVGQASYYTLWALGKKGVLTAAYNEAITNLSYGCYRTFTMTDSGVVFDAGYGIGNSYSGGVDNSLALPTQIYGINLPESGKEGINNTEHDIDAIVTNLGVKNVTNIIVTLDYTKNS